MKKKFFLFYIFFINIFYLNAGNNVSDTWAQIQKYIAVNSGLSVESWSSSSNAIITNGETVMTPVGDGTYEIKLKLTPGATYNYMFFAKTNDTPPAGLKANQVYWDCVPNGGLIPCGTNSVTPTSWDTSQLTPCYFAGVGDFNSNARRIITVPSNLNSSDTFYVFNNFSNKPGTVNNFKAEAIDTKTVLLSWSAPYGYWGDGQEEKKAADVIAGGTYAILRYINNDSSAYQLITTLPGNVFSYTDTGAPDTGLNQGYWYYYAIVSYDAYLGAVGAAFEQGVSSWSNVDTAVPNPPVKVIFKVEGINYDYIKKHNYVVWLTPKINNKKYYKKIPAIIHRIKL